MKARIVTSAAFRQAAPLVPERRAAHPALNWLWMADVSASALLLAMVGQINAECAAAIDHARRTTDSRQLLSVLAAILRKRDDGLAAARQRYLSETPKTTAHPHHAPK